MHSRRLSSMDNIITNLAISVHGLREHKSVVILSTPNYYTILFLQPGNIIHCLDYWPHFGFNYSYNILAVLPLAAFGCLF